MLSLAWNNPFCHIPSEIICTPNRKWKQCVVPGLNWSESSLFSALHTLPLPPIHELQSHTLSMRYKYCHIFKETLLKVFIPPANTLLTFSDDGAQVSRSISFRPVMLRDEIKPGFSWSIWIQSCCLVPSTCRSEDDGVIPRFMTTLTFALYQNNHNCTRK